MCYYLLGRANFHTIPRHRKISRFGNLLELLSFDLPAHGFTLRKTDALVLPEES